VNVSKETTEKLARYIASELLNQANLAIGVDDDLLGSGLLDSLSVMSLVYHIEQEFGISIPAEDVLIENFGSLSAIDSYVGRRRAKQG
jgi:acyl carrier protein